MSPRLAIHCPACERRQVPPLNSDDVVAWYRCPSCGAEWLARLRNGEPEAPVMFVEPTTRD